MKRDTSAQGESRVHVSQVLTLLLEDQNHVLQLTLATTFHLRVPPLKEFAQMECTPKREHWSVSIVLQVMNVAVQLKAHARQDSFPLVGLHLVFTV